MGLDERLDDIGTSLTLIAADLSRIAQALERLSPPPAEETDPTEEKHCDFQYGSHINSLPIQKNEEGRNVPRI
jgi:hypothetical protein